MVYLHSFALLLCSDCGRMKVENMKVENLSRFPFVKYVPYSHLFSCALILRVFKFMKVTIKVAKNKSRNTIRIL